MGETGPKEQTGQLGPKLVAGTISFLLSLSMFCVFDISFDIIEMVDGEVLHVNKTGSNGAYTSIQDAIDDAGVGDTVFVYNGTYN
ncbi:MAG: hypothetical protein OEX02_19805, partial [Cyclobacteriaceae bacterium]|nr:hypothetical protein [Cyclobacteriaceae bacterium]